MIKSLRVTNFQSHKDTVLNLHDGVNVVVGPSDGGKSAVLRALKWVTTNRPSGDEFRSRWGGDTVVEVETDGMSVVRAKTGKKNVYQISRPAADGRQIEDLVFKAIGQDVPDEVSAALNFGAINTQSQMDSPFLLSDDWSPGRVADYLNDVVGLNTIGSAQTAVNAELRGLRQQLASTEQQVAADKRAADDLAYVDAMAADISRLETWQAKATQVRQQEQRLFAAVEDVKGTERLLAALPNRQAAERLVTDVSDKVRQADSLQKEADSLQVQLDNINTIQAKLDAIDDRLQASPAVAKLINDCGLLVTLDDGYNIVKTVVADIGNIRNRLLPIDGRLRASRLVDRLIEQETRRQQLVSDASQLEAILAGVYESQEIGEAVGLRLKHLEARWHEMAPDVCPLCEGRGKLK